MVRELCCWGKKTVKAYRASACSPPSEKVIRCLPAGYLKFLHRVKDYSVQFAKCLNKNKAWEPKIPNHPIVNFSTEVLRMWTPNDPSSRLVTQAWVRHLCLRMSYWHIPLGCYPSCVQRHNFLFSARRIALTQCRSFTIYLRTLKFSRPEKSFSTLGGKAEFRLSRSPIKL